MGRISYLVFGFLSLGVGLIGLFVPVLPTTCFVLLAAFCFSKSSPAWHQRLRSHPRFGAAVRAWQDQGAISAAGKRLATMTIIPSFLLSAAWIGGVFVSGAFLLGGALLLIFIWRCPLAKYSFPETKSRSA